MAGERPWKGNTGGGSWGQRGLILMVRYLGIRFVYLVVAMVIPFYMLFSRSSALAIYCYFRHRLGYTRRRALVRTYRNHLVFGQVVVDRFAIFAGQKDLFHLEITGNEHFLHLLNGQQGFIIAGAHVGNFEIAGYLLHAGRKRVNALFYPGETHTVRRNRMEVLGDNDTRVVPVTDDMTHLFIIRTALQDGEIVTISCDRHLGSSKSVTCDFLGERADFPAGPFALADILNVDILPVFVMKAGARKYVVHVKPVIQAAGATRHEAVATRARAFAGELEAILREYPEQWFNYYPFWKEENNP